MISNLLHIDKTMTISENPIQSYVLKLKNVQNGKSFPLRKQIGNRLNISHIHYRYK